MRQSTADQVLNNHESRRRQYALTDRARALGWSNVEVIDDDLGRSGSGVTRPGFEKLLAAICEGRVGAVVSIEASRLARNGRDWHTLLEFCGIVDTLIVDEDGVYDPRHPNDRLLLGMKGTMSEMELSLFRQRSFEALRQKARRGELLLTVAVGYVKMPNNRIEKDPDRRVQEAITLVFTRFAALQTVRQVHLWMRQEKLPLPAVEYGPEGRRITWKLPVYNSLRQMLTNPVYAGAYVFGRTGSRVTIQDGRKRIVRGFRKEQEKWEVLIRDHHSAYISWAEFERNQRLISDNANGKSFMSRGSVRRGEALLAGLLRCGHCGRKLHVAYGGAKGSVGRNHCRGGHLNHGGDQCISFGGMRIDRAVGAEAVRRLQPLGIEAALNVLLWSKWKPRPSCANSTSRLSRRAMRRHSRAGNTMRSIPTTAWWPAKSSDAGMNAWRRSAPLRPTARRWRLAQEPVLMPPSGAACSPLGPTLSVLGTARARPPQPASASSAR